MKKRIICFALAMLCIFSLFSCNEAPPIDEIPDDSGQQTPPEENNNQAEKETIEYGYKLLQEDFEEYVSYRLAYKVSANNVYSANRNPYFTIKLSHGAGGSWYSGGYIYPNVKRIELVFEDTVLCEDEYFDYLDNYLYFSTWINSTIGPWPLTVGNKKMELYTSENYDGNPGSWLRFNNEEEYYLPFTENKEEYTFQIREIYFDGSIKVVCEAKLYARFDGDTVHFSAEPFDEAE